MKNGSNTVQDDANTRTGAFRYFGAVMLKQGFDVGPFDVCADRLGEDSVQCSLVFRHAQWYHAMVSRSSTGAGLDAPAVKKRCQEPFKTAKGSQPFSRPKISALMHGKFKGVSAGRLSRCLNDLGQEIEITIRPAASRPMRR